MEQSKSSSDDVGDVHGRLDTNVGGNHLGLTKEERRNHPMIMLGPRHESAEDVLDALIEMGYKVGDGAKEALLFKKSKFRISEVKSISTIRITSIAEIGVPTGEPAEVLYDRIADMLREKGLALCPTETAPFFLLQGVYKRASTRTDVLHFISEVMKTKEEHEVIFTVYFEEGVPVLDVTRVSVRGSDLESGNSRLIVAFD